jgi:tetratricopeptide (TPR) repeat protein
LSTVEHEPGAATGFAVLGLASVVFAVFQPHIRNLKAGPSGFELETVRVEELQLASEIRETLGGVGTADLAVSSGAGTLRDHGQKLDEVLGSLQTLQQMLDALRDQQGGVGLAPAVELELARGLLAKRRWREAAEMFDNYVDADPDDWEAHFARGAAYANVRGGNTTDLAALRAYNEALALAPREEVDAWLSRFYGYRGAILKRLGRLDEAENDLRLAASKAVSDVDRDDAAYNLAAVYALSRRRDEALAEIASLRGSRFMQAIEAHEHDYFASLADDLEFRRLLDTEE